MNDSPVPGDELARALYVVATPIGHLGDVSARAASVLARVPYIAAEDTRTSRTLLVRLGCRARVFAAHEHNEAEAAHRIIGLLREGHPVALISDAGTPAVSDPGTRIVSAVIQANFPVVPVPGPSALTALLSASGIVEGPFHFEGFLPAKPRARTARLSVLANLGEPFVLFESPHRITATLEAIAQSCGDRRWMAIGRELTKKFEQIHRCEACQALHWLEADPMRGRGEFALVVAQDGWVPDTVAKRTPASAKNDEDTVAVSMNQLLSALVSELGPSRASRLVERLCHKPHRQVYAQALLLAAATPSDGGASEPIA